VTYQFLGIDPGLRHTGVCLLQTGADPLFYECKPYALNVLTACSELREGLGKFIQREVGPPVIVSVEKQLSVGAYSSSLMFHVQMAVYEVLELSLCEFGLVAPLPVQLKSYMRKERGVDITNATSIVASFKESHPECTRISQHCVDAYYLAKLARDVLAGRWTYRLPSKEMALHPWEIIHDERERAGHPDQGAKKA